MGCKCAVESSGGITSTRFRIEVLQTHADVVSTSPSRTRGALGFPELVC